jgi:hypothetical protein
MDNLAPSRRLHPSAFLLAAHITQLVLYAFLSDNGSAHALLTAFSMLLLVLVVWVVIDSPGHSALAWGLALPAAALSLLSLLHSLPALTGIYALLGAVLYLYGAGSLIVYMLSDETVTTDELYAIGATFTLLAWGFAYAYQACQVWLPGSFTSLEVPARALNFLDFLFLSFHNLVSAGLADLLPGSGWARVLIMLEQFTGVLYVAVVISRLVGLTVRRRTHPRH